MLDTRDAEALINDLFEEEVVVLDGMATTKRLDDEAVWTLVRSLDVIRGRTLRRLRDGAPGESPRTPHPAIVEFLARLRDTRDPEAQP